MSTGAPPPPAAPNWVEKVNLALLALTLAAGLSGGVFTYFTITRIDGRLKELDEQSKAVELARGRLPLVDFHTDIGEIDLGQGKPAPSNLKVLGLHVVIKNNGKDPLKLGTLTTKVSEGVPNPELQSLFLPTVPAPSLPGSPTQPVNAVPTDDRLYRFDGSTLDWKEMPGMTKQSKLDRTLLPGQEAEVTVRFILSNGSRAGAFYRFESSLDPAETVNGKPNYDRQVSTIEYSGGKMQFKTRSNLPTYMSLPGFGDGKILVYGEPPGAKPLIVGVE